MEKSLSFFVNTPCKFQDVKRFFKNVTKIAKPNWDRGEGGEIGEGNAFYKLIYLLLINVWSIINSNNTGTKGWKPTVFAPSQTKPNIFTSFINSTRYCNP